MSTAALWLYQPRARRREVRVSADTVDEAALLGEALAGDRVALRRLVQHLTPTVQAKVARALLAQGRCSHQRNVREEVRDLSQEIFALLFEDDAHILRTFDPARGVSLRGFVGVVAARRAISHLRSSRRNPWTEDPTDCVDLDHLRASRRDADRQVVARELLDKATAKVRGGLSERGEQMFELIVVQDASNDEIKEATGMSTDAVYQWRSRLMKAMRSTLRDLGGAPR